MLLEEGVLIMIRIVVFGVGQAYENRKYLYEEMGDRVEIVAFIDNNTTRQGTVQDSILVYAPDEITSIDYDGIVISSNKYKKEMSKQLIELGVEEDNIWDFKRLQREALRGHKTVYDFGRKVDPSKKNILILSTDMNFSGGTLVAIYAAKALKNAGYEVMLAAPMINLQLLVEIMNDGLCATIWESLPYIYEEDYEWLEKYDAVIVNVFQMMNCAYEISKKKPVLWWIHEVHSPWVTFYRETQHIFKDIASKEWMKKVNVVGVSNIAKEAFNFFYPGIMHEIMPFGIPDRYNPDYIEEKHDRLIFAVTAGYAEFKGQNVLVDAVKCLPEKEQQQIELWFIGPRGENRKALEVVCDGLKNVRFLGLLPHEAVVSKLPHIDVIVCPSLIESMSMSTIEGMMFRKICIVTNRTGIASYIDDGKNGFVCQIGDSLELAEKISWIINHKDELETIKNAARKTYEKFFSIENFGKDLKNKLERMGV